jgi:hypothetical protein
MACCVLALHRLCCGGSPRLATLIHSHDLGRSCWQMRLNRFRRRVVLVRLFLLSFLLPPSLFVFVFYRPSNRDAISHAGGTLSLVDALLDEALHSALSIRPTYQDHDGSRAHLRGTEAPLGPTSHQAPSASSAAIVSDTLRAQVCQILQGRTIFLVGPHDTLYQLHSFLLRTLHAPEPPGATTAPAPATVPTTRASCPGPSSCPFHPLCLHHHPIDPLSQSPSPSPPPPGPEPFTPADIATSTTNKSTGFLRFLHSGNLNPSPTQEDPDPQLGIGVPLVDPRTGVRVIDSRWVRQVASKASILVLNRGPLPAPAWSYGDKEKDKGDSVSAAARNLTWLSMLRALEKQHAAEPPLSFSPFADVLSRLDHLLPLPSASHDDDFQKRLLSAALHSTISTFLPSLLSTLTKLRDHAGHRAILGKKPVLWYGSWFLPVSCSPDSLSVFSQNSNSDPRRLLARLLAQAEAVHNPWSAYYNAQGLYDGNCKGQLPVYAKNSLPQYTCMTDSLHGFCPRTV